MYILCKKDFNRNYFDFKEGFKYPITNICDEVYYFDYPNKQKGNETIRKHYLEENKDYLEIINEMSCNHSIENRWEYLGRVVCMDCDELVKINT